MGVNRLIAERLVFYILRYFGLTLGIYRDVFEAVSLAVKAEWSAISGVEHSKLQKSYAENLIHATRSNLSPKYSEFDQRFHKFPSYLRRAAIAEAIGNVSSHMTKLKQWEGSPKGKAPTFNPCYKSFPVFYKGVMSEWVRNDKVKLKLFTGSDWIWFTVSFEKLKPHRFPFSEGWERQNPMLVYNGYKWHIHFPFQRKVKLKDKDFTRPILSVDLGLNCTATTSVVYSDGTVVHREFINYASEKDRRYTLIGTIAVKSAQTYYIHEGSSFCKFLWRKVSSITEEIADQCSARLVAIDGEFGCQSIVFEHLGKLKVPKNFYGAARLRRKFHH